MDYNVARYLIVGFLFGIAIGNAIIGFKIGPDKEYHGRFIDLISPYTVLTGVFNLVIFTLHGAIYLYLKTEGDLQQKVKTWIVKIYRVFVSLYIILYCCHILDLQGENQN